MAVIHLSTLEVLSKLLLTSQIKKLPYLMHPLVCPFVRDLEPSWIISHGWDHCPGLFVEAARRRPGSIAA